MAGPRLVTAKVTCCGLPSIETWTADPGSPYLIALATRLWTASRIRDASNLPCTAPSQCSEISDSGKAAFSSSTSSASSSHRSHNLRSMDSPTPMMRDELASMKSASRK